MQNFAHWGGMYIKNRSNDWLSDSFGWRFHVERGDIILLLWVIILLLIKWRSMLDYTLFEEVEYGWVREVIGGYPYSNNIIEQLPGYWGGG